jgi:hypothetical protein
VIDLDVVSAMLMQEYEDNGIKYREYRALIL